MNTTTATAIRTGNTLVVTRPDGTTYTTSGKRAAGAVAVSLGKWSHDGTYCLGVHGTIAAAHRHARTYSAPSSPGGAYWTEAQVIPVTEAGA